jgi:PLP dependent protein
MVSDDATASTAARVAAVRERIAAACARRGRDPADVRLVGITKTHAAEVVAAAYEAGLPDFGENRVQEAAPKIAELRARGIAPTWHLVGHLQRNKVPAALGLFDILHSVDSIGLAERINAHAEERVRILLEVNVAADPSKFGVSPTDTAALASQIGRLDRIELLGLMTVAPQVDDVESVRPLFRELRELRDAIGLNELSMGMTDDFEVAVEEGSTLVRVGRAIFGDRAQ